MTGWPSGTVYSARVAPPACRVSRRTTSPTSTASSTRAVIRRGVDTATSTPQESSKSHSLRGLFTRATVRGTPNSLRASRDVIRFALSSPVAATTTSALFGCTWRSTDSSQASPICQRTPGRSARFLTSGLESMMVTSWPFIMSSLAMEAPTEPAPTMRTFTYFSPFEWSRWRPMSSRGSGSSGGVSPRWNSCSMTGPSLCFCSAGFFGPWGCLRCGCLRWPEAGA